MTPGDTPVAVNPNKSKNRYGALASPVTPQRDASRIPLSSKSQNITSNGPMEANWRIKRKSVTSGVPPRSIANGQWFGLRFITNFSLVPRIAPTAVPLDSAQRQNESK
jgi:hypothetical protein